MSTAAAERPVVLTVAGSDSAGMAGLQMDIRTQDAMGVHSACALSANTAQDNERLLALQPLPAGQLDAQLQAALALRPVAVKAGMLASAAQVRALCEFLDATGLPLVYDPVLKSSSGYALADGDLLEALRAHLLKRCALLTPNLEEAGRLTGAAVGGPADIEAAARRLASLGAGAVLIKGGHGSGAFAQDYFLARISHQPSAAAAPGHALATDAGEKCGLAPVRAFWLSSPRRGGPAVRGTGCALASAIASSLALGHSLDDAVVIGKMALNQGLRQAYSSGGRATVRVGGFPASGEDLPLLHVSAMEDPRRPAFPGCGRDLGLYPVVDRAAWLRRLLPLGISTAQLRVKDLEGAALAREIAEAVDLGRRHACRLFINDHWELAIRHGAYGVHLGQDDLGRADLERIRAAGLRLGLSTHCHYEVAAAHAWRPSYIACGPIYPTTSKQMPWLPHGPEGLRYWRRVLSGYPLVAIGGIDRERIGEVAAAGADGIALITAVTEAPDPEASARELMAAMSAGRRVPSTQSQSRLRK